jgi:hypothetical protein
MAGDVVTCVFEVGNMVVGLGLHQTALAEPHVALDGKDIALEGGELGFCPQEGVGEIAHTDKLRVQPWVTWGLGHVAEESVSRWWPKEEVSEPGGESSNALALGGMPRLSVDLKDPRVLAVGLIEVISEDAAVLEFLDPVSDVKTAVIHVNEEVGILIVIDLVPQGCCKPSWLLLSYLQPLFQLFDALVEGKLDANSDGFTLLLLFHAGLQGLA